MKITTKKCLALFLALLLTLPLALAPLAQAAKTNAAAAGEPDQSAGNMAVLGEPKPEVSSEILASMEAPNCKSAILMDAQTGQVLYAYLAPGQDKHVYPASITKVMTALLTLEAVDRGELSLTQLITASDDIRKDLSAGGSTANIQPGEQMSVEDLLYCLMLPSANEAANVLAEAVSGSTTAFVALMNERAKELGMNDTNFANTHGLHNANHYTTAYDLALLVQKALENETFTTIVSQTRHTIPPTNLTEKERTLKTTNALLDTTLYGPNYRYVPAIGVKTGSTDEAGKCLASAARQGNDVLICVVLGAQEIKDEEGVMTRYQFYESKRLLDWGFKNFTRKPLVSANPVTELPVELSADTTAVAVKPGDIPEVMLPNDVDPKDFQQDITLTAQTLAAPVEAGQVVGEMTVRNGETVYAVIPLVAAASAQRSQFLGGVRTVQNFFSNTWVKVAIVALVVLIVVLIVRFTMFKPRGGYRGKTRRQSRHRSRR